MAEVKQCKTVSYNAQDMFALVNDTNEYPDFLPWCTRTTDEIISQEQKKATIYIEKGPVKEYFTTLNTLISPSLIKMELVDGPFKRLEGCWKFEQLATGGCIVSLNLEYEFSNRIIALAIAPVFKMITISMVDAFCSRAIRKYS